MLASMRVRSEVLGVGPWNLGSSLVDQEIGVCVFLIVSAMINLRS